MQFSGLMVDPASRLYIKDLTSAKNAEKTKVTIIVGDLNAEIGAKLLQIVHTSELLAKGERNEKGQMTEFLSKQKIYCLNTFFKKHSNR